MKKHKCKALKSLSSQHRLTGSTPRRPDILHTHLSTRQHHAAGNEHATAENELLESEMPPCHTHPGLVPSSN